MFLTSDYIRVLSGTVLLDSVAFLPELILCVTVVVMLLLGLFTATSRVHLGWLALACSVGALAVAAMQWSGYVFPTPAGFLAQINALRTGLGQPSLQRPEMFA